MNEDGSVAFVGAAARTAKRLGGGPVDATDSDAAAAADVPNANIIALATVLELEVPKENMQFGRVNEAR